MKRSTLLLSLLAAASFASACGGGDDTGTGGGGGGDGGNGHGGGDAGNGNGALLFGPYKDTGVNMNWDTSVISTKVSGTQAVFADDLNAAGGNVVSLAFATGECGNERWGGVPGAAMAAANVPVLEAAGVGYILSTGGAAGSFTCGSDAGFGAFLDRWAGPHLIGVDLDIEAGQSPQVIAALVQRLETAHAAYPNLRFSLTLATLASNEGASTARSLGSNIRSSLNVLGDAAMAAVADVFGFDGSAATWPSYVTVNLMTMNYGSPGPGVCVVSGGQCDMGQSAIQAAYNLHDHFGVPYANIELTPMIGGNDVRGELYTLTDVDETAAFARSQGLAGVHYWSYDRDVDCPIGAASPVCNSLGNAGTRGFLARFLAAGL
ncbi:glycosyl hydrolase [Sorangium sp. So ce117]|uniref:glycosyl hydrolase n=1 Tax=Sorangium sp. So ce117 TaxID=3133277 RepID=UPI003F600BC8